jgi:hypothetical protein
MVARSWATLLFAALLAELGACSQFPSDAGDGDASAQVTTLPNRALHFDGVGDFATCGTARFPTGATPQAVSVWVRYPSTSGTHAFLVLRRDETSGLEFGLRDGNLAVWNVYGGETLLQAPAPSTDTWHHVAYSFATSSADAGIEGTLYVDGKALTSGTVTPNTLTPISSWIGTFDGLTDLYAGDMDEIRIWNVSRAATDIASDMQGTTPATASGLVALFDGDTVDGTRLPDRSGNGNDVTLGGGDPSRMPTLVPSGLPASEAP